MQQAKKILLAVGVILVFIAYSFQQRHKTTAIVVAPASNKNGQTQSSSSSTTPVDTSTPDSSSPVTDNASSNNSSSGTAPAAKYKDGQYTGNAADAFYGDIQVKAIISGGKITDIQFLQSPNDQQNSVFINQQADPILKQEAIKAQTAHVDTVSGATDTTTAFIESLTNALDQAV